VFYPLQTNCLKQNSRFQDDSHLLRSENSTDFRLLEKVAKVISDKVFAINSEQRKALRVAAVS
jgi:hypothetical protein